jgi:hypothetical protein
MSDYERYGDYDDTEEDGEKSPSAIVRILKALAFLLLASVCALIALRLIVAAYYPKAFKRVYMTDALTAYAATNTLDFEKRSIDVPVDDPVTASFLAANLLVDEKAGALQFSLRMGNDTMQVLAERKGLDSTPSYEDGLFVFRLTDNKGRQYEPSHSFSKAYFWYRAIKLCFDGVQFEEDLAWIRVDIYEAVDGEADLASEPYASVPLCIWVYEIVD